MKKPTQNLEQTSLNSSASRAMLVTEEIVRSFPPKMSNSQDSLSIEDAAPRGGTTETGAARHIEPAGLTMERPFKSTLDASSRASVKPTQRLYRPMVRSSSLLAKLL